MRARFWTLIAAMLLLGALALGLGSCSPAPARGPVNSPVPTKTLRPTFTPTVPKPALTPSAAADQTGAGSNGQPTQQAPASQASKPTSEPPTATAVPPTAAPSPTPESAAAFTVSSASINVRSGPGTTYPVLGRLTQGQSFPITGKSADADWWQFDYNGKTGWVVSSNVTAAGADTVQVAQNIPKPPTAAPRPTARPAAPKPAQPPAQPAQPQAANNKAALFESHRYGDSNDRITVLCLQWHSSTPGALAPGTMRVLRDGQPVGPDVTFSDKAADVTYLNRQYNAGCKIEVSPAAPGSYTAVLIEGGQPASEPFNFTVTGPDDRITWVAWKQR